MVSASKIADRMPQLPDVELPEVPFDLDDVTGRIRDITGAATNAARQAASTTARKTGKPSGPAVPLTVLGLLGVLIAAFFVVRSRRSSGESDT